jgi:hypothetical protein
MKTAFNPRVNRLLSFLALFERRDYSYGEWRSPPGQFPYLAANEDVSRFIQILYEDGWVEPFDWGNANRGPKCCTATALRLAGLGSQRSGACSHFTSERTDSVRATWRRC